MSFEDCVANAGAKVKSEDTVEDSVGNANANAVFVEFIA